MADDETKHLCRKKAAVSRLSLFVARFRTLVVLYTFVTCAFRMFTIVCVLMHINEHDNCAQPDMQYILCAVQAYTHTNIGAVNMHTHTHNAYAHTNTRAHNENGPDALERIWNNDKSQCELHHTKKCAAFGCVHVCPLS